MSNQTGSISRSAVRAFTSAEQLKRALCRFPKPQHGRLVAKASDRLASELKRDGKISKIQFELRDYDFDLHTCHQDACDALDKLALQHAPSLFHRGTDTYTMDGLPKGVSLGLGYDVDSTGEHHLVWRVQVYWHNGHCSKNKCFRIGYFDLVDQSMIDDVCRVASEFRRAYDQARLDREPFDPSPWRDWRTLLTEETQEALQRCRALLKKESIARIQKTAVG